MIIATYTTNHRQDLSSLLREGLMLIASNERAVFLQCQHATLEAAIANQTRLNQKGFQIIITKTKRLIKEQDHA